MKYDLGSKPPVKRNLQDLALLTAGVLHRAMVVQVKFCRCYASGGNRTLNGGEQGQAAARPSKFRPAASPMEFATGKIETLGAASRHPTVLPVANHERGIRVPLCAPRPRHRF